MILALLTDCEGVCFGKDFDTVEQASAYLTGAAAGMGMSRREFVVEVSESEVEWHYKGNVDERVWCR